MTQISNAETSLGERIRAEIADWVKTLAWAIPAFLIFTTTAYAQYSIPSESMVPTLEVGDRVIVSKFSYGYSRFSLPLNMGVLAAPSDKRLFERMPERGDVVVFIHPQDGRVMIKRLIGMPGDRVAMRENHLWLNGEPVGETEPALLTREAHRNGLEIVTQAVETLPNGVRHWIHRRPEGGQDAEYPEHVVPEGYFFFMGDNRDNSADSRTMGMGMVPFENLIGRAETVWLALNFCAPREDVTCPRNRWFKPLQET
jgi:signal peptidase I